MRKPLKDFWFNKGGKGLKIYQMICLPGRMCAADNASGVVVGGRADEDVARVGAGTSERHFFVWKILKIFG